MGTTIRPSVNESERTRFSARATEVALIYYVFLSPSRCVQKTKVKERKRIKKKKPGPRSRIPARRWRWLSRQHEFSVFGRVAHDSD